MRCYIGYFLICSAITLLIGGGLCFLDGFTLRETIVFLAYIECFLVLIIVGGYLIVE